MRYVLISLALFSSAALAWEGYDYDANSHVTIESGNLVRDGESIDFYDYSSGEYRTGEVESINRSGSSVEVEVYDYDAGEYRTFEMQD